jgi:hypothetical protein
VRRKVHGDKGQCCKYSAGSLQIFVETSVYTAAAAETAAAAAAAAATRGWRSRLFGCAVATSTDWARLATGLVVYAQHM